MQEEKVFIEKFRAIKTYDEKLTEDFIGLVDAYYAQLTDDCGETPKISDETRVSLREKSGR